MNKYHHITNTSIDIVGFGRPFYILHADFYKQSLIIWILGPSSCRQLEESDEFIKLPFFAVMKPLKAGKDNMTVL